MNAAAEPIQGIESLACLKDAPAATAVMKQQPQDFQVEEVFGFEFDGRGEHLCLFLEKTGLTTTDLARQLARTYELAPTDVGYAGMKDKQGVCRQWFSLRQPVGRELDPKLIESESVQVCEVRHNSRKIHIGSHKGNRFRLRLRDVRDPAKEINRRLEQIAREAVPNYFGPQRFGFDMANVRDAIELLTSAPGRSMPRDRQSLLLSAARSFLFNQICSYRVEQGSWNQGLPGEVFNLDGTARCFVPKDDELPAIALRLAQMDIHPTGLLAGKQSAKDRYRPGATVEGLEQQVLAPWQSVVAGLAVRGVMAGRRPLRLVVQELQYHWPAADQLELTFGLTAGGYATTVLREICRVS